MALTYGFYSSKNGDRRYDAKQFGSIFDGIINDGVYSTIGDKFAVTSKSDGLKVYVGTGRAWFRHTWTLNTTPLAVSIASPEPTLDRWDTIVLEIDHREDYRRNRIYSKKGTPAANPQKPAFPGSWEDTSDLKQVPLAYVRVRAGSTYIKPSDIDYRVAKTECPLIIAPVIGHMTADELLQNWETEYANYLYDRTVRWNAFQNGMEVEISSYENLMEEQFFNWLETQKHNYGQFIDHNDLAWRNWFEHIQYVLDGDVAGHLQTQIDEIAKFKHIYVVDKVLYVPMSGASVSGKKLIFAT